MKKQYPGHAKRVMFGVWSFLRQFMYTKFIIVTDDDVDIRDWKEVVWALTTRVDPARDTLLVESTPIDYLDFASPVAGLGSKMGIDATNKWPGETQREWGRPIAMDAAVQGRASTRSCANWSYDGSVRFNPALGSPGAPRAKRAVRGDADRHLADQAPQASRPEQWQRKSNQRGGHRPGRAAALRGRRRHQNAARRAPRVQRLHALQVGLGDQPRLALGEFLGPVHGSSGGGRGPRGESAASATRSLSISASDAVNGIGAV